MVRTSGATASKDDSLALTQSRNRALLQTVKEGIPKANTIVTGIDKSKLTEEKNMKIHFVKHNPKSEEEMLKILVHEQQNKFGTTSLRKATKKAKSRLEHRIAHIKEREQKLEEACEISEVETVVPSQSLFQVDVNLDNLKEHLAQLRSHLGRQDEQLANLEKQVNLRATEKIMGTYLTRIAKCIPKSLGERPHAFKLNDPGFFHEEFDTEDGHLLKEGVERVIEKLEILSSITLKNHKSKIKTEQRLKKLEAAEVQYLKKEQYA